MSTTLTGAEFKKQLRDGVPKLGIFVNSHSPTVIEQLAHSGYDWLLVDTQHGPMGNERLSSMLAGIANGGAKSLVRVGGYSDRAGIQFGHGLGQSVDRHRIHVDGTGDVLDGSLLRLHRSVPDVPMLDRLGPLLGIFQVDVHLLTSRTLRSRRHHRRRTNGPS